MSVILLGAIATAEDEVDAGDPLLHAAIGRLVGDTREAAGIPQSAAARAMGVSQSRIARIELGKRRLLFAEAVQLAKLYGVDIAAFDPRDRSVAETAPRTERRRRIDGPRKPRARGKHSRP